MNQLAQLREFNRVVTSPASLDYVRTVVGEKEANVFLTTLVSLASKSPLLLNCEPTSVMYAALKSVALKLPIDPSLGYAYVIPYGRDAQFQVGYRGLYQLALRSGQFTFINVCDVKEGELSEDLLTGEITLNPARNRETLPTVGYCAFFRLKNGFEKSHYMTIDQIKAHGARYSKTFSNTNGTWARDFEAMAKKTVLKLLLSRWAPTSVDIQQGLTADAMIFNKSGVGEYADNPQTDVCDTSAVEIVEDSINSKLDQNGGGN